MTVNAQDSAGRSAFLALDFVRYIIDNFSSDPAVAERAAAALSLFCTDRSERIYCITGVTNVYGHQGSS